MKIKALHSLMLLTFATSALAYDGPSPLKDIKVDFSSSFNTSTKLYIFNYKVINPQSNEGNIWKFDISLPRNPTSDMNLSMEGLTHCSDYNRRSSEDIFTKTPIVPVGSTTPNNWSCSYTVRNGGGYGWGSNDSPYRIKPGSSLGGFSLSSYGPPGIQNVIVEPAIYYNKLPEKYEDPDLLAALEENVKWSGKTIGPTAPPKVFVASDFINNLISLKDQSLSLGWIKEKGVANSLDVKLNDAKKKIAAGDNKTAKNILSAFQNELQAQNGKQVSSEAYALLYYNAKYLIEHL
jgi:hypothetical protein